jgi:transcription antitermination factor NusG
MSSEETVISEAAVQGKVLTPFWFAVHTRSRHEVRVYDQLFLKDIEAFLPMYASLRRWSDRQKRILLPLFGGYIFVHIPWTSEARLKVLKTYGVARIVSDQERAAPVPDEQILAIQRLVSEKYAVEPYPFLEVGREVEIRRGSLKGLRGILIRKKGAYRFVVSVNLIRQSVAVEIDASELEPIL